MGLTLQQAASEARRNNKIPDTVYFLEHRPTITLGRGAHGDENLRSDRAALFARGIDVAETDRGGDITYHCPGQLVGYPILNLDLSGRDLHAYIRSLERVLINTLAVFGVVATTVPGRTGVWTNDAKIAAIGIKVSRWISSHGFALNIDSDLKPMRHDIVPCGISDKDVISLSELGVRTTRRDVEELIVREFAAVFNVLPEYQRSSMGAEMSRLASARGLCANAV